MGKEGPLEEVGEEEAGEDLGRGHGAPQEDVAHEAQGAPEAHARQLGRPWAGRQHWRRPCWNLKRQQRQPAQKAADGGDGTVQYRTSLLGS